METLKEQFNSRASWPVARLRGRDQALAPFGWTGDKGAWITLVCLHSGAFTRAQCARFLDAHPEQVRRVVHALIAQGLAAEDTMPRIWAIGRVCRIFSRRLYRTLGAEDIRHRRVASPTVLMRRLLSLDYVLKHSDLPWLPTEPEKVGAFQALGIERRLLPSQLYRGAAGSTRRYFPLKLPVARGAPCSSTSIPATTPRRPSTLGARCTATSGWPSPSATAPSRSSPSSAPTRSSTGPRQSSTVGPNPPAPPDPTLRPDAEIREEVARIERAILQGAVAVLEEFGGLQAAMKCSVALEKQVRRQPAPGLIPRASTWRTMRLAGAPYQ